MSSVSRDTPSPKDKVHTFNKKRIRENSPSTKSRGEIYAATFQGISSDGEQSAIDCNKAMKLDATSPIKIDNSHLPSTSWGSSRTFSDTGSSTGQVDSFLAIPGPSGIQRNTNPINLSVSNLKSTYSKRFCNTCEKEYIEGYLHDSEHTCTVCCMKFQCRTVYNEHLLGHRDHFMKHCWICTKDLAEHLTRPYKRKLFKCCICDQWEDKNLYNFIKHNRTHQPQIFCKKCKKEYDIKEKEFHDSKFLCSMCESIFDCKIQLEEHYDVHERDFQSKCIGCKGVKHKHDFKQNGITFYKCCNCAKLLDERTLLQTHIVTHLGLRLYKCNKCETRFATKSYAQDHPRFCTPLPHRCEICRLRFSSDDSLHDHLSAKHIQA